jgi:hypothetical protein
MNYEVQLSISLFLNNQKKEIVSKIIKRYLLKQPLFKVKSISEFHFFTE